MKEEKVKIKQVRLYGHVDEKLEAIVSKRIKANSLINTKTAVIADLVIKAHKRECRDG